MKGIIIGGNSEGVWDGVGGFGKAVTFAVRQHTGNKPCLIKIQNITTNWQI